MTADSTDEPVVLVTRGENCKHCGAKIWTAPKKDGTARKGRRYCSKRCAWLESDKKRGPRDWSKKWREARARGPYNCLRCGKTYSTKRGAGQGETYCSRKCYYQHRREGLFTPVCFDYTRVELVECDVCRSTHYRAEGSSKVCSTQCEAVVRKQIAKSRFAALMMAKRPFPPRVCCHCGIIFSPPKKESQIYCSKTCSARAERKRHPTSHRARARRAGVEYKAVTPLEIFQRDGWKCQICGRKTPKKHRGTTRATAPELDHVVPLAMKGNHTPDNLQCACRDCNIKKGGNNIVGQMPLFEKVFV